MKILNKKRKQSVKGGCYRVETDSSVIADIASLGDILKNTNIGGGSGASLSSQGYGGGNCSSGQGIELDHEFDVP